MKRGRSSRLATPRWREPLPDRDYERNHIYEPKENWLNKDVALCSQALIIPEHPHYAGRAWAASFCFAFSASFSVSFAGRCSNCIVGKATSAHNANKSNSSGEWSVQCAGLLPLRLSGRKLGS
jgi:hypothetical protein